MHSHNRTHISRQVSPTCCHGEVFCRIETISVHHKVAVVFVHRRGLAAIAVVEELGDGFALEIVNLVHVEPCAVGGQDDGMVLVDEV